MERIDVTPHVASFEPHVGGDVLRERVAGQLAVAQRDADVFGQHDMFAVEVLAHLVGVEHLRYPVVRRRPVVQRAQLLDVVERRSSQIDRAHESDATDRPSRQRQALRSATMTPEEFRSHGHALIDLITEYLEDIEQRPVSSHVKPGDIRAELPEHPPASPEPFQQVVDDLRSIVIPGLTHWQHPQYFAYFPATRRTPRSSVSWRRPGSASRE